MGRAGIWERLVQREGVSVLQSSGVASGAILERLEAGEGPADVAARLDLDAADLIAALAHDALGSEGAGAPPLIRTTPRRPRLARSLEEPAWAALLPTTTRAGRLALLAGLLQVHDFWDASHEAAQAADDLGEPSVAAYWHAIAHRREPDAGNASYWFRRVGPHPVFAKLRLAATPLLDGSGAPEKVGRLFRGGTWDPLAFIALCANDRPDGDVADLARALQRLEMRLLLEFTAQDLGIV